MAIHPIAIEIFQSGLTEWPTNIPIHRANEDGEYHETQVSKVLNVHGFWRKTGRSLCYSVNQMSVLTCTAVFPPLSKSPWEDTKSLPGLLFLVTLINNSQWPTFEIAWKLACWEFYGGIRRMSRGWGNDSVHLSCQRACYRRFNSQQLHLIWRFFTVMAMPPG